MFIVGRFIRTNVAVWGAIAVLLGWATWNSSQSVTNVLLTIVMVGMIGPLFFAPVTLVAFYLYDKKVGQSWMRTKRLDEVWRGIEGHRVFLEQAELGRLQYEAIEPDSAKRSRHLANAVALGLNTKWLERFVDASKRTLTEQ
jgi:hypothetical protein